MRRLSFYSSMNRVFHRHEENAVLLPLGSRRCAGRYNACRIINCVLSDGFCRATLHIKRLQDLLNEYLDD